MDGSTLGKIEVRARTRPSSSTGLHQRLQEAEGRHGSGTASCAARRDDLRRRARCIRGEPRTFMTTTTGGAAAVLDWMEEWLQTEWPELDVHCTSVTEQWATIAVVGPRSREVVAHLAPGVDLSATTTSRSWPGETDPASGVPARICRISFSGELAYEINVSAWYGLAVWEAGVRGRAPAYGITPYGTETMHVLRAEKGYPIVGQDTDGTVTPQDSACPGWSRRRRTSSASAPTPAPTPPAPTASTWSACSPGRRQDPAARGHPAHRGRTCSPPGRPVPMLGHVTSSYHSAALGRPFALALVAGGRAGSARPCSRRWARSWCPSGGRLRPLRPRRDQASG
jgi:sarcosine oxidase subunit alpha